MDTTPLNTAAQDPASPQNPTASHAHTTAQEANSLHLPAVIPFVFPGLSGVRCAFGTALTGNLSFAAAPDAASQAAVRANRRRLLNHCGLAGWSELQQVHGDVCIEVTGPTDVDTAPTVEADAQFTDKTDLGLVIKTADCQPILLTSTTGSAIAALHVGWRGNVLNVPAVGVRTFCQAYGLMPSEVMVVRGPSLGPGEAEFVNFGQEWGPAFLPWFDTEHQTMDLWSLTRHQLTEAGVLPQNIFSVDLCTKSLPELFFSYRRKDEGRQISLIWRE